MNITIIGSKRCARMAIRIEHLIRIGEDFFVQFKEEYNDRPTYNSPVVLVDGVLCRADNHWQRLINNNKHPVGRELNQELEIAYMLGALGQGVSKKFNDSSTIPKLFEYRDTKYLRYSFGKEFEWYTWTGEEDK